MVEVEMTTPRGVFEVRRPHASASSALRAWSAADQLVLDHLGERDLGRVLVVNDEFGALAVGLADGDVTTWSDSVLSRNAAAQNLQGNARPEPMTVLAGTDTPTGSYDTVVVRVPKSTALLEYQLAKVATVCSTKTELVGAGMARHIHTSTLQAFERFLGATTTSLATRKARLIHTSFAEASEASIAPPRSFVLEGGTTVVEQPGTFSAGHLDVGTALLLDVLASEPVPPADVVVADVGCGNGVIGARLAQHWSSASFVCLDVSDLAVEAATQTFAANGLTDRATFTVADGCTELGDDSVDVIVTNPPFHQGHALDADLTDRILADTARVLRAGGKAYVVAQRHLHLHTRMKKWFGTVDISSKHPSHVVLTASSPR